MFAGGSPPSESRLTHAGKSIGGEKSGNRVTGTGQRWERGYLRPKLSHLRPKLSRLRPILSHLRLIARTANIVAFTSTTIVACAKNRWLPRPRTSTSTSILILTKKWAFGLVAAAAGSTQLLYCKWVQEPFRYALKYCSCYYLGNRGHKRYDDSVESFFLASDAMCGRSTFYFVFIPSMRCLHYHGAPSNTNLQYLLKHAEYMSNQSRRYFVAMISTFSTHYKVRATQQYTTVLYNYEWMMPLLPLQLQ